MRKMSWVVCLVLLVLIGGVARVSLAEGVSGASPVGATLMVVPEWPEGVRKQGMWVDLARETPAGERVVAMADGGAREPFVFKFEKLTPGKYRYFARELGVGEKGLDIRGEVVIEAGQDIVTVKAKVAPVDVVKVKLRLVGDPEGTEVRRVAVFYGRDGVNRGYIAAGADPVELRLVGKEKYTIAVEAQTRRDKEVSYGPFVPADVAKEGITLKVTRTLPTLILSGEMKGIRKVLPYGGGVLYTISEAGKSTTESRPASFPLPEGEDVQEFRNEVYDLADGTYELDAHVYGSGSAVLALDKPVGFVVKAGKATPPKLVLSFGSDRLGQAEVQVMGKDGKPLERATVELRAIVNGEEDHGPAHVMKTDGKGSGRTPPLFANRTYVVYVGMDGLPTLRKVVEFKSGDQKITLSYAKEVTAWRCRVVNEDGKGTAATVYLGIGLGRAGDVVVSTSREGAVSVDTLGHYYPLLVQGEDGKGNVGYAVLDGPPKEEVVLKLAPVGAKRQVKVTCPAKLLWKGGSPLPRLSGIRFCEKGTMLPSGWMEPPSPNVEGSQEGSTTFVGNTYIAPGKYDSVAIFRKGGDYVVVRSAVDVPATGDIEVVITEKAIGEAIPMRQALERVRKAGE